MNRIDEIIEEALLADEALIAEDDFCQRVLSSLPRKRRSVMDSVARRVSLAVAACVGSLVTLLLGAPVEDLFAGFIQYGELSSALLGASAVAGIIVIPLVWLIYTETEAIECDDGPANTAQRSKFEI